MYLMTSTRCGLSAKQLEREIGVSCPTAWRMLNLIRSQLMRQDETPLEGEVEVDETAGGGKIRAGDSAEGRQHVSTKMSRRPTIWAAVERGGRIKAQVVRSRSTVDIEPPIFRYVLPSSMIFTDEWLGYTSRTGFAAPITRCRASGFSRISTSTRGGTTSAATPPVPCLKRCWKGLRHERVGSDQGNPQSGVSARASGTVTAPGNQRATAVHPRGTKSGCLDQSDCSRGWSVSAGRLRPAGGATFLTIASKSLRLGDWNLQPCPGLLSPGALAGHLRPNPAS